MYRRLILKESYRNKDGICLIKTHVYCNKMFIPSPPCAFVLLGFAMSCIVHHTPCVPFRFRCNQQVLRHTQNSIVLLPCYNTCHVCAVPHVPFVFNCVVVPCIIVIPLVFAVKCFSLLLTFTFLYIYLLY